MLMPSEKAFVAIESVDEIQEAIQAARTHAQKVYASGRTTLIKRFSVEEIRSWDGSDERALVSDPDGHDVPDVMEHDKAA